MKILLVDIETAPHVAWVWGLWDKFISIDRIQEAGYTMCWAAKWYDNKKMMFSSIQQDGTEVMLEKIHALLEEADAVVHYNGKKFDIPTLNREFLKIGLTPPAPYKQIDLLSVVRRNFRFPSNKMDYVARELGLGEKIKHKGFQLWKDCMAGNRSAWKTMKEYNKGDVVLLESLYVELLPWISGHPNRAAEANAHVCPTCGGNHLHRRGYHTTQVGKYQRWQCLDCGKWSRGRRMEKPEVQVDFVVGL